MHKIHVNLILSSYYSSLKCWVSPPPPSTLFFRPMRKLCNLWRHNAKHLIKIFFSSKNTTKIWYSLKLSPPLRLYVLASSPAVSCHVTSASASISCSHICILCHVFLYYTMLYNTRNKTQITLHTWDKIKTEKPNFIYKDSFSLFKSL